MLQYLHDFTLQSAIKCYVKNLIFLTSIYAFFPTYLFNLSHTVYLYPFKSKIIYKQKLISTL